MIAVLDVNAMPVVTTTAQNLVTTLCAEASSEGPLSHRTDCTPEQAAVAACMHGGTCYLTPFQRPGCACPSEFEGLRCEQRALDIGGDRNRHLDDDRQSSVVSDTFNNEYVGQHLTAQYYETEIGPSLYDLKPGEYVAIGAVIAAFVFIALITVILIVRYRRQRSRYHLSSNLLDHEQPAEEKNPEKEEKKVTLLPDSTPSNNNNLSIARPPSRARLSAVGRSPSEEENLNTLTVQPGPEITEVVTGV